MDLYIINFDEPKTFKDVNTIAKAADKHAVISVFENPDGKLYQTQSEKAANAVCKELSGTVTVIDSPRGIPKL